MKTPENVTNVTLNRIPSYSGPYMSLRSGMLGAAPEYTYLHSTICPKSQCRTSFGDAQCSSSVSESQTDIPSKSCSLLRKDAHKGAIHALRPKSEPEAPNSPKAVSSKYGLWIELRLLTRRPLPTTKSRLRPPAPWTEKRLPWQGPPGPRSSIFA